MITEDLEKDYAGFSCEDFLTDDFFIRSISDPTPETSAFWAGFLHNNPDREDEFRAAEHLILALREPAPESVLPSAEKAELWNDIQTLNKHNSRTRGNRRRTLTRAVAASAAAVVLLGATLILSRENAPEPAIVSFANDNVRALENGESTLLMLSDEDTVRIEEHEAVITYKPGDITVNSVEITKKEDIKFNQLVLPKGKRSMVCLADGTTIWVNGGSRLVYPAEFGSQAREVFVDGEIFLDVKPDASRPFIVRTGVVTIRVLGTKFNVSAYSGDPDTKVVLVSGSVKAGFGNKAAQMLQPGQMYDYSDGKASITNVDVERYTSWIHGLYYYERETLAVVASRLSRNYGIEISCDPDAGRLEFSGKLDLKENIADVLNGIAFAAPINIARHDNGNYTIGLQREN